jgi:hypothetical protein
LCMSPMSWCEGVAGGNGHEASSAPQPGRILAFPVLVSGIIHISICSVSKYCDPNFLRSHRSSSIRNCKDLCEDRTLTSVLNKFLYQFNI